MTTGIGLNEVYSRLGRAATEGSAPDLSPALKQQVAAEFARLAHDGVLPESGVDAFLRGVSKKLNLRSPDAVRTAGLSAPHRTGVAAGARVDVGKAALGIELGEVVVRAGVVRGPHAENVVCGPFHFTKETSWATGHETGFYSMGMLTLSDQHWQAGWNAAYQEVMKLNAVYDWVMTAKEIYDGKASAVGLAAKEVEGAAKLAGRETTRAVEKQMLEKIETYAAGVGTAISVCSALGEIRETNRRGPGTVDAAAFEITARIMAAQYGSGQLAVGGMGSYCKVEAPPRGDFAAREYDAIANQIFTAVSVTLAGMKDSPQYGQKMAKILGDSAAFNEFQKSFVDSSGGSYRIAADRMIADNKRTFKGTIVEYTGPAARSSR